MSIVLQSSGGGQITLQEPATASNFTQTLPAATGTVVISGTTPTLNGITFPATQVPSADANTLDDYEEGTWTPTVSDGTFSATGYAVRTGNYTKVGNIVTVISSITLTNKGSIAASIIITGLPFSTSINGFQGAGLAQAGFLGLTSTLTGGIYGSALYLYNQATTGQTNLTGSNFTNTSTFDISITYTVV